MKAAIYHRYGDSDVLQYGDIERPTPGAGQVLVKVAGTSFNPVDAGIRGGYLSEVFPITFPHIPGIDVAGTIVELGDGVTGWHVGDAVVGLLPMAARGAAAEYVVAPAEVLAAAGKSLPLADFAALPTVGLTAWQALFEIAELGAGQTILINGAGGAVGGYAVQLAKHAGAVVTATAKATAAERLRGYGADHLIDYLDYAATPVLDSEPFDVVLNLVSTTPDETDVLGGLMADGGRYVGTMTSGPGQRVFVRSDAVQLVGLVEQVDAGQLRIDIADRRPLADIAAVHADADARRLPGKTILTVG
ncbi:NADP-dependent oxidoreductase [Mycobacterium crocinum]|uniref:NADP-dependent oxidoreductase n=1 Tax=Mycolicibacterium crocinum TaxID=388459 RepID=A0ABY3TIC5_9MYCO|nr:NADP-dependent oxidoreductase [Mycolicibacterium crocinum]MCV7218402.1 NADP-dependent oxidoreductase [Mycolicibacterium crocinum]ULN39905.1 NADP-dependent oxidoreductase [Mycolicibacterium crocinum]